MRLLTIKFYIMLGIILGTSTLYAQSSEQVLIDVVSPSRTTIKKAITALGELGSTEALEVLEALQENRLRRDADGNPFMLIADDSKVLNLLTRQTVEVDSVGELARPIINNSVRRILLPTLASIRLESSDDDVRLKAANELNKRPNAKAIPLIEVALAKEQNASVKSLLLVALAQTQLQSDDPEVVIQAIEAIGESGNTDLKLKLEEFVEKDDEGNYYEPNEAIVVAATGALDVLESRQAIVNQVGNLFYGLSLGSILLLAALGLAITFGLMGVINMAHGEMIMLGAYSVYFVQSLFEQYLPDYMSWYLLASVPVAFGVTGFIGIVIEQTIIRFLYGRQLETLLATWGISLILIQTVRLIFGAQNVEVANPEWLSGGFEVLHGLVIPYSRMAIILFAGFTVVLTWFLIQRTPLGLQVRAVTQNRSMASCMGIATTRVDMWTFGLGSGLAGLAGVALSQVGNVGPEMGQAYIVDSFMVVVLGGVGKIAGAVAGGMGLGVVNKFLEPATGAVLGKILVLVFIILFIQKRPQGIFALKGRVVEN
ncbi:MAG: urea ABC transporter permease subunit UrtB [Deltaproteobacteria bacterium]|jgi:urea transport system permease protein|nr:urea ABC transporter permease subunit UrtB [Deltaproteobacteria bacterium]MBT6435324.1 urea ABC transporter permease subunit UrtB [Deltaproteobacteria bacterium]MBT6490608.1 urea ABC transporter permease subunit UrtB [Deltaproteobacteria bacterium]